MQQFMQNSAELTQYANDMQYIKMIKKIVVTFLIVINICEIYSFVVSWIKHKALRSLHNE